MAKNVNIFYYVSKKLWMGIFMSSLCCCCRETRPPANDQSDGIHYRTFTTHENEGLTSAFGHHRARSINAPTVQSMDTPVSSLLSSDVDRSEEIKQLREELALANAQIDQQTEESKGLRAQLDLERRNSIAASRTVKDLTFSCEDLGQRLEKMREELDEQQAHTRQLQAELQTSKSLSQQHEAGLKEKSREIERLENKLNGKERTNAQLTQELHDQNRRPSIASPTSVSSPTEHRRHSVDDQGKLLRAMEDLQRAKKELEELQTRYEELTVQHRVIPVLERKLKDATNRLIEMQMDLNAHITVSNNRTKDLNARNEQLIRKLQEAGVEGFGMHHRRRSSSIHR